MGYRILFNTVTIQRLVVCFGGVMFAVFVVFQYIEFPYGDVISSLFSADNICKTKTERFIDEKPSQISQISGEITQAANSTAASSYSGGNATLAAPINLLGSVVSGPDRNVSNSGHGFEKHEARTKSIVPWVNVSSVMEVPNRTQKGNVVSISEMHDILVHNRASSRSVKPRWRSRADQGLLEAKMQIENARFSDDDDSLYPSVFRNISIFRRSYELMEKTLKIYIYKEGEKPIFHQPEAVMKGIYASEGWFMKQMKASKRFVTRKPKQAHLFYIPYSAKMLKVTIYRKSYDRGSVVSYLKNYRDMIAGRYGFWNRTGGADHFLVACHDWAADETRQFMGTCIRAICNTDVEKAGFELGKDVPLPETNVRYPQNPLKNIGGKPPSKRTVFAFFAGQKHGHLRSILLRHWENKDPDMKIFGKLPKVKDDQNYVDYMKRSKFCICAKGYEVHSPRVVEAIFYECVPVIISDNYVPPFFEVLDWESFAVFVREKDIPDLKNILLSIPNRKYLQMHRRVKEVQQHFLWHVEPVKYDIFHMILHSVWYTRVFRVNPR